MAMNVLTPRFKQTLAVRVSRCADTAPGMCRDNDTTSNGFEQKLSGLVKVVGARLMVYAERITRCRSYFEQVLGSLIKLSSE
jgi:hypothetical protein